jgi:hypothetical protein
MPSFTIFRTGDHRAVEMSAYFGSKLMCQILASEKGGAVQEVFDLQWITPVFGSGSLATAGSLMLDSDDIVAQIAAHLSHLDPPPQMSESWETIAERFTRSLIGSRCAPEPGRQWEPVKIQVDEQAALLILVTALATRFCHAARSMSPEALTRSSDERVRIDLANWSSLDDPYHLAATVLDPLLGPFEAPGLIARLRGLLANDPEMQPLTRLLVAVARGLSSSNDGADQNKSGISLNTMRLLTEATWLQLVRSQEVYYGWSELLVDLLLTADGMVVSEQGGSSPTFARRPHQAAQESDIDRIITAFQSATGRSWFGENRSDIHRSVAAMLREQASWSARHAPTRVAATGQKSHPMPRSVAISVSFDLELEMALVREGQSYQVAVPLYAVKGQTRDADLIWMCATVRSPAELEAIRAPVDWFPLTRGNKRLLDPSLPLIIRATGCPLLKITGAENEVKKLLTDNPAYSFQPNDLSNLGVQHAVTVDEYLALRQAEVEIYQAVASRDVTKPNVTDISVAFEHGRSRNDIFFTFLGVPFADPAVRQRLLSLLTARWVGNIGDEDRGRLSERLVPTNEVGAGSELSDEARRTHLRAERARRRAKEWPTAAEAGSEDLMGRSVAAVPGAAAAGAPKLATNQADDNGVELPAAVKGLAVNSRLDPDEAALLASLGLQVVHGRCDDLSRHLDDYTAHLDNGTFSAFNMDRCNLSRAATTMRTKAER